MKKLILILCFAPMLGLAQQVNSQPLRITTDGNVAGITLITPSANAPAIVVHDGTNNVFRVAANGALVLACTTNQITFGATNSAPVSTNSVKWISVAVVGDTNVYRLGLCK